MSWFLFAALAVISVVGAWVAYQLTIQHGRLILRIETLERALQEQGIRTGGAVESGGLPVGSMLNEFELPSLSGEPMTLSQWKGRKLLIVFFDPKCEPSGHFLLHLAAAALPDPKALQVIIISTGDVDTHRRIFEPLDINVPVLLQTGREVAKLYRSTATPSAYLVDEQGRTTSPLLIGGESIMAQLESTSEPAPRMGQAFSRHAPVSKLIRDGLKSGSAAPDFTLPTLQGNDLSLSSFRGNPVLLVFSDPNCGPCDRLAPKLEELHRQSRNLKVLMISRGDPDANRKKAAEHKLSFPIVLQKHWEISRQYGMFATPIAYIVDPNGFLQTDVLVGVDAIHQTASRFPAAAYTSRSMSVPA